VLIGENGSGKSTLVEAIAVAAGFNAACGSANFNSSTRASESGLHANLRLTRGTKWPKTGFFLRAESFFNVATEVENRNAGQFYVRDALADCARLSRSKNPAPLKRGYSSGEIRRDRQFALTLDFMARPRFDRRRCCQRPWLYAVSAAKLGMNCAGSPASSVEVALLAQAASASSVRSSSVGEETRIAKN
jgi:energy-coupling factor transporter ATP-binding protein EcfA2